MTEDYELDSIENAPKENRCSKPFKQMLSEETKTTFICLREDGHEGPHAWVDNFGEVSEYHIEGIEGAITEGEQE